MVSCEHVDSRVDIAVFVIDGRADKARGQFPPDVVEFFTYLIPSVGDIFTSHGVLDLHKCHHPIRDAVGQQKVELWSLSQFVLDFSSYIPLHFVGGSSGPYCSDNHRLDRKRRIFGASHAQISDQASDAASDHQKSDKGLVGHSPSRKVPTQVAFKQLRAIRVVSTGALIVIGSVLSWHDEPNFLEVVLPNAYRALWIDPLNPGADDLVPRS